MENTSENKSKQYISLGLLAHVDAGKTTLSESILYLCGNIRKPGRVDHKDAFLDTYELEKARGITIFSKQAVVSLGDSQVTLLDTPGHVDFSAEMERVLQVLDYGVLIINGADGVQGHTRTLWKLLERYHVPAFLFVNKMDQEGTDRDALLAELKDKLDGGCIPFDEGFSEELYESLATCDEEALEEYLDKGELERETITRMIAERKVFPCYFGSALKIEGVQEFLDGLELYTKMSGNTAGISRENGEAQFGARVYKISRDNQGNRLTHLKITSGVLRVRDTVSGQEKINQIRIYSGEKFEAVKEAETGMICAVTGLTQTYPGEGLGCEQDSKPPVLEPVLNYRVLLPEGCDIHRMLGNLRQLEEEDPLLKVVWKEELQEICVCLMGEVQIDVLKSMIEERFGVSVSFDTGNIVYKETITRTAEGVGHFEPLRHYAEVHLILEPGEPGSGLVFDTECSEDVLDRNWQRLILTHLAEREHRGVLTGSGITDMKITLAAGRAHLKHTEGGDFRQATYRAVRQGLMQAESVLLEPYYDFTLEVPAGMVGRALTDIQRMDGEFLPPETEGEMAVLQGFAPVSCMRDYQREVISYTKGRGRLACTFRGYGPCHNPEEVIEEKGYDPLTDQDDPVGSVFCSHGAGIYIPWNEVPEHMHIESQLKLRGIRKEEEHVPQTGSGRDGGSGRANGNGERTSWDPRQEKELEEIFIRTYGKIERRTPPGTKTVEGKKEKRAKKQEALTEYLLVDGYNVIHAWDDLKELAAVDISAARDKLMDVLCNYQGFRKCVVILVFDAYNVEGDALEIQKYHNIHVVYTKEAETADQYIEKVVHEIGRRYHVTVVTSDGVEQVITLGQGGSLISAREFREEVKLVSDLIREEADRRTGGGRNYLFDQMGEEFVRKMEDVRLGRREL